MSLGAACSSEPSQLSGPSQSSGPQPSATPPGLVVTESSDPGRPAEIPPGQSLHPTDLLILGEGNDEQVRDAVARHGGEIVAVLAEVQTYRARFPVADLAELARIRDSLAALGLDVVFNPTLELGG